jgi:hypothetical protein
MQGVSRAFFRPTPTNNGKYILVFTKDRSAQNTDASATVYWCLADTESATCGTFYNLSNSAITHAFSFTADGTYMVGVNSNDNTVVFYQHDGSTWYTPVAINAPTYNGTSVLFTNAAVSPKDLGSSTYAYFFSSPMGFPNYSFVGTTPSGMVNLSQIDSITINSQAVKFSQNGNLFYCGNTVSIVEYGSGSYSFSGRQTYDKFAVSTSDQIQEIYASYNADVGYFALVATPSEMDLLVLSASTSNFAKGNTGQNNIWAIDSNNNRAFALNVKKFELKCYNLTSTNASKGVLLSLNNGDFVISQIGGVALSVSIPNAPEKLFSFIRPDATKVVVSLTLPYVTSKGAYGGYYNASYNTIGFGNSDGMSMQKYGATYNVSDVSVVGGFLYGGTIQYVRSSNQIETGSGGISVNPTWTYSTYMLTDFGNNTFNAGTSENGSIETQIYRKTEGNSALKLLYSAPSSITQLKDYGIQSASVYQYEKFYMDSSYRFFGADQSGDFCKQFVAYSLIEATEDPQYPNVFHVLNVFRFTGNISAGGVSNNNTPSWLTNFTPYRLKQPSARAGKSGTLQALLGYIDPVTHKYVDNTSMQDNLWEASLRNNTFFLKDMKGNMYMVAISNPITQTINTKSKPQQVTVSVPWEEIGDASEVSVIQIPTDAGWKD